jgi:photosystem II stability/assembly factor-like uncharacterized protein
LNNRIVVACAIIIMVVLISSGPVQAATNYGRWRDISPTQYVQADPTGTLRGVYMRQSGYGSIGAADGWAVGGDSGNPIIAHYDGFSWEIRSAPVAGAVYNAVHFCTSPGAPGVGLCSPNGDGSDGWIVGEGPVGSQALYWDGAALTPVTTGLTATVVLNSVFMACHSPQWGSGCPSVLGPGLTFAVGSDAGAGVIYQFNGDPKAGGGWTLQVIGGTATTSYNGVYMYGDNAGHLAGFAVGDNGVVAQYSGTWTATQIPAAAGINLNSVFVDQQSPADAWAVGDSGGGSNNQIWHYGPAGWTGPVSPFSTVNPENLYSVFLTSSSEGWIVGQEGTILHSTTLGSSNVWLALTEPLQTAVGTGIDLLGVTFEPDGWAVGTMGVILNTQVSDCNSAVPSPCWGGQTSITQVTPGQQLNAVYELGSSDAWAGGSWDTTSGISSVIHWDGYKWHRATVAPLYVANPDIYGIYMLGSGEGWAVGGSATVPEALKWDGNTWTGQPIGNCGACSAVPRSVFMISGGTGGDGWIVGTNGRIWRYQSGSWLIFANPTPNNLNSVFISNPGDNTNAGWAVGDAGTVLRLQIVGGIPSWVAQSVPGITTQNLYGTYWKDSDHGWIVGDTATIVSTTDGGNTWSGGANQVIGAPAGTILRSVSIDTYGTGSGNGDGWAVGYDAAGNPVFAHWDGAGWTSVVINPPLATTGLGLYSVYVTGPEEGWAVGAGMSGITSLSGIFHLDPLNPPISGGGTSAGTTTIVVTSGTSTLVLPSGTYTITSTSASTTTTSTSTSVITESTTSTSSSISTETSTSTSTEMSTSFTSNTLNVPGIPGFPWESILAGIIVGLIASGVIRRTRKK